MTGGAGRDVFIFQTPASIGLTLVARDAITDYTAAPDVIALTAIDANSIVAGNQAFAFIGAAALTNVAGQLRYSTTDGLLQGDIDGNSLADFALELSSRPVLLVLDILP